MRRRIPGLQQASQSEVCELEGIFLVRVERAFYRWHPAKPFFVLRFAILEPKESAGQSFPGRLYCTQKALWKLHWFLRDFGYDTDLLGKDEVDERALVGLRGVVRVSRTRINGHSCLNLDGFAPAGQWEELAVLPASGRKGEAMGHDL